jgi:hypothetical protein
MDPQQRVLLEMASEAFEQAGIPFIDVRQPLRRLCGSVERRLCLPPHRIDGIHPGGAEHDLQGHHEPRIARGACGVQDSGERDGVGDAGTQAREYPKTEERPE